MGWEERKGRLYYYRKRREGNRVVSEYLGSGELAGAIAALDQIEREEREYKRWVERQEREALDREAGQVDEVLDLIRTLTHAALIASGYHTHKGQWRKRREQGKSQSR